MTLHLQQSTRPPAGVAPGGPDSFGFVFHDDLAGYPVDAVDASITGVNNADYDGVNFYSNGNSDQLIAGWLPGRQNVNDWFDRNDGSQGPNGARITGACRTSTNGEAAWKFNIYNPGDYLVSLSWNKQHSGTSQISRIGIVADTDTVAENQYAVTGSVSTSRTHANGVQVAVGSWLGTEAANRVLLSSVQNYIVVLVGTTGGSYPNFASIRVDRQ